MDTLVPKVTILVWLVTLPVLPLLVAMVSVWGHFLTCFGLFLHWFHNRAIWTFSTNEVRPVTCQRTFFLNFQFCLTADTRNQNMRRHTVLRETKRLPAMTDPDVHDHALQSGITIFAIICRKVTLKCLRLCYRTKGHLDIILTSSRQSQVFHVVTSCHWASGSGCSAVT